MTEPAVYLEALDGSYVDRIRAGLEWTSVTSRLSPDTRVFIKPNLTFPVFRKGVMTDPDCVEAIVIALKDYTSHIVIGEADSGGYNRFDIDVVQEKTGLKAIAARYGVSCVNLSHMPRRTLHVPTRGRTLDVPFPVCLLDETDLVLSAAVPKIHMNTMVSMTVKNLWGCIPEPDDRLRLHPYLSDVLHTIVTRLKETVGLIDGRYGLNRSGPMEGDVVDLNWLMVAASLYQADATCCDLMQIPVDHVAYMRQASRLGTSFAPASRCRLNANWQDFVSERFYLKRKWTDYPGYLAFHSPALSYLAYFSPLAGILHKLLYCFRKPFYDYDNPN